MSQQQPDLSFLNRDLSTRFRAAIQSRELGQYLWYVDEVASTQDTVRRACVSARAPHGFVVVAGSQREGRGQHGRRWDSQNGAGLYFSVLLRRLPPLSALGLVALGAGLAVANGLTKLLRSPSSKEPSKTTRAPNKSALGNHGSNKSSPAPLIAGTSTDAHNNYSSCSEHKRFNSSAPPPDELRGRRGKLETSDIQIKWPNDVLVRGKKCAGVLVESQSQGGSAFAIVGMGINLRERAWTTQPRFPATSIEATCAELLADPNTAPKLLALILQEFERTLELARGDTRTLCTEVNARLAWKNKTVNYTYNDPTKPRRGRVLGVNNRGALLLDDIHPKSKMTSPVSVTCGQIRPANF